MVQETYLKAFRLFDTYSDQNSHAWILTIVRNSAYTWLKQNRKNRCAASFEENDCTALAVHDEASHISAYLDPSEWLAIQSDISLLRRAVDLLPLHFKEIVVLREIEGCSYKELSEILEIPPGTVMSRLARARQMLQSTLFIENTKEKSNEL